jgi:hypothetical protein
MSNFSPAAIMLGLDVLMIIFSLWVLSMFKPIGKLGVAIAAAMFVWLSVLYLEGVQYFV